VGEAQYKGLGNAKDWVVKAPAKGLLVDGTPAVGSVAVRTTGAYGHTAFVEELNPAGYPAGTIRVSQYNYRGDGNYSEQIGTPASLGLLAFIHFEVYMPAPAITLAADPPAPEPAVSVSVEPSATPLAEETTGTLEPQLEVTGTAPLAEEEQAVIEASPAPTGLLADEIADPPATERQVQQEPKPEAKLVAAESPPITAAVASDISQPLPGQTQLRQATGSPPTVAPAKLARYNKTIDNNVPQIPDAPAPFSYWPLMGLLGVVLVREAALRPYPRSYHPA
jgi:hypothetical protein